MPKAVFYQSIGPELARYDIDVEGGKSVLIVSPSGDFIGE